MGSILMCGPSGGPRGEDHGFNDFVGPHLRIAAVRLRSKSSIDGIQLITRRLSDGRLDSPGYHGGFGGEFGELTLSLGEEITEISGTSESLIDSIRFVTSFENVAMFGTDNPSHMPYEYTVPPGCRFAGIFGRSGQYLDALGVLLLEDE